MRRTLLVLITLECAAAVAGAQERDSISSYPSFFGLSVEGSIGSYALRDEFISREKYSGALPGVIVEWSDFGGPRGDRFTLEYCRSSSIRNHNVSAGILEFAFGMDWLYPVGRFSVFSRDVFAYLGPSAEMFIHFRSQNLATGGLAIFRTYSFASLFSLGATATVVCPMSQDFLADASIAANLVALGGRLVNPDDTQASMLEFLTLFSGLRCKADAGLRYVPYSNLSVRLGYRLEVVRIDAWDYFISGSDMAVLSVRYGF